MAAESFNQPVHSASREVDVVHWVAAIGLFWTVSALYLGGFQLRIEGGGAFQHLVGLLITLALYLGVFALVHSLLIGPVGPVLSIVFGCLAGVLLLPLESRLGFMILGVKIRSAAHS
jgi:hypothetical protein